MKFKLALFFIFIIATITTKPHELTEYAKIIGLSMASAVAYGILQDQITARNCLEYFTEGFHKKSVETWKGEPIMDTLRTIILKYNNSPTIVATIWGTVATWWVGLPLGILLSLSARSGTLPKLSAQNLSSPLLASLGITGLSSLITGSLAYYLTKNGNLIFPKKNLKGVPKNKIPSWGANAVAHSTAYSVGFLSGLGLCAWTLAKRYFTERIQENPVAISQGIQDTFGNFLFSMF